jgi:hypothetical protein
LIPVDSTQAALIGAAVGVVGGGLFGVATAVITGRLQRGTTREARQEDRRAVAYLDLVMAVGLFQRRLESIVDPHSAQDLEDFDSDTLRARLDKATAQVDLYGTSAVQRLEAEVRQVAGTFLAAAKGAPLGPERPVDLLRARSNVFKEKVAALTNQMNSELNP